MNERKSTWSLIAVPALITLAVTLLRLVGELQHWPAPWFNNAAGGGAALVGISWLPIFFGPWFAVKLARSGEAPANGGKAIGFAVLSAAVWFGGGFWLQSMYPNLSYLAFIPCLVMLAAAFLPGIGWPSLGRTLVAYAFAARIPVLLVMFLAMNGNGGKGWGTHYDAVAPAMASLSFTRKYLYEAFVPQMTLWIGWTVAVGALFGSVAGVLARRGKQPAPANA
jgi:hypothetical protein